MSTRCVFRTAARGDKKFWVSTQHAVRVRALKLIVLILWSISSDVMLRLLQVSYCRPQRLLQLRLQPERRPLWQSQALGALMRTCSQHQLLMQQRQQSQIQQQRVSQTALSPENSPPSTPLMLISGSTPVLRRCCDLRGISVASSPAGSSAQRRGCRVQTCWTALASALYRLQERLVAPSWAGHWSTSRCRT